MKLIFGTFFFVVIDFITKQIIKTKFFFFTKIRVIDGILNLVYVKNKGIAFGLLRNLPDHLKKYFLIYLPVVIIIILSFYIISAKKISKLTLWGFILIISGALGNLIDRYFYGYVVDFIDVYVKNFHWPAFNFADAYITIGTFLLILDECFRKKRNY